MNEEEAVEFAQKWRQHRSCARCRRLKIKCSFQNPTDKDCMRCLYAKAECSPLHDPTAKLARKPKRQPEDGAIEPYKKKRNYKVRSIQDLVRLSQETLQAVEIANSIEPNLLDELIASHALITERLQSFVPNKKQALLNGAYPHIAFENNLLHELIEVRMLFTIGEAQRRFEFFVNKMLPYYPIVTLSGSLMDFNHLYREQPLLLTACISVTAVNDNGLSKDPLISNSQFYNLLTHYLYSFVSYLINIKCEDFSTRLIHVCQILSSWCLPPHKVGHFKNQMNTLMAFNISLCIDLAKVPENISLDKEYRNNLRTLLSVYCSSGSLELALRRFKLVSWNENLANAVQVLSSPSEFSIKEDKFLCSFVKIVAIGQEMMDFLASQTESSNHTTLSSTLQHYHVSNVQMKYLLKNYEQKLNQILSEFSTLFGEDPPGKAIMNITYYQLMIMIYDTMISQYLNKIQPTDSNTTFQNAEREICLQHIFKLVHTCENMINTFVKLNHKTINFPTVLYYRPMNALVTLIKLRLALKSLKFKIDDDVTSPELAGEISTKFEINIEYYYELVYKLITENVKNYNLVVCENMTFILNNIEKWMKVSRVYNERIGKENGQDLVHLINRSNNKEIETLSVPKIYEESAEVPTLPTIQDLNPHVDPSDLAFFDDGTTLEDFFDKVGGDVVNYINSHSFDFGLDSI